MQVKANVHAWVPQRLVIKVSQGHVITTSRKNIIKLHELLDLVHMNQCVLHVVSYFHIQIHTKTVFTNAFSY